MFDTASKAAALALAGFCAFAAAAPAARASVIYTFTTTQATNNGSNPNVTGALPLTLSLNISDAAAQSGTFLLNGSGSGASPVFTSSNGFNSLTVTVGSTSEQVSSTSLNGSVSARLTFNAAGFVSSSLLTYTGVNSSILLGTGTAASGSVGSSLGGACNTTAASGVCQVTGVWTSAAAPTTGGGGTGGGTGGGSGGGTPVPEPASLALFGLGALALGLARRAGGASAPARRSTLA